MATCISSHESERFAERVMEKLTDQQKQNLSITNDNKQQALGFIQDRAERTLRLEEEKSKRAKMMQDPEGFIDDLENTISKIDVSEEEFDAVQDNYNYVVEELKNAGFSRIHKQEYTGLEQDIAKQHEAFLGSFGDLIVYYITRKTDGTISSISWVVREPRKAEVKTLQERTLERLQKVSEIQSFFVDMEIKRGAEVDYVKSQEELDKRNENLEKNEQWKLTGRNRYMYNGKKIVTKSVSIDVHGFKENPDIPIISGPIGEMVDTVGRLFFSYSPKLFDREGNLVNDALLEALINSELLGMFTLQGLKNLIRDFQSLKDDMIELWGDNLRFFSGTLKLFAKQKNAEEWIYGKPDLLVIDDNGIVHVVDFKTHKIKDLRGYENTIHDNWNAAEDYGRQISRYIRMLESYGFKVDPQPYVILADTYYDSSDRGENNYNEKGELKEGRKEIYNVQKNKYNQTTHLTEMQTGHSMGKVAEREGNPTREEAMTSEEQIIFIEPRLHVKTIKDPNTGSITLSHELEALRGATDSNGNVDIPFEDTLSYEQQWDQMTEDEQKAMLWLKARPMSAPVAQGIRKLNEKDIQSRPDLIGINELRHLANTVMHKVSSIITELQKGTGVYSSIPLSMKEEGGSPVLTGKSRKEIIRMVGLENIINEAMSGIEMSYDENFPTEEEYANNDYDDDEDVGYVFEDENDYQVQKRINDKAKWILDHREQFISLGKQKLMALEDSIGLVKNKKRKNNNTPNINTQGEENNVAKDTGDNLANATFAEQYEEGLSDLEAWMLGERNYSPKASLAQEIRRLFETLEMKNADGTPMTDPYGWGYKEYVNSTMAVQAVFEACKNCETYDQMKEKLENMSLAPGNTWVKDLLAKLENNNNLRIKFYRQFRKDALTYTINEVKYDKKTGQIIVQARIINTKTAYATMMQSLGASFNNGTVGTYKIGDKDVSVIEMSLEGDALKPRLRTRGRGYVIDKVIEDAGKWQARIKELYQEWSATKYGGTQREFVKEQLEKRKYEGKTIAEGITEILHGVGIMVTPDVVLNCFLKNLGIGSGGKSQGITSMGYKLLLKAIKVAGDLKTMNNSKDGIPDGLTGNDAFPTYKDILEILSYDVQEMVEASVYQDGKTYYSYANPSKLGSIIRNLKNALGNEKEFDKYMEENYGRFKGWYKDEDGEWLCDWLAQLDDSTGDAREALAHTVELAYKGTKYKDLGALGFQLSILHNYFGTRDDQYNKAKGYRYFALPTMSNKPTNEFIRMKKYKDADEIVERVLMPTFQQEINRITDVLYHFVNSNTPVAKLDLTSKKLEKAGIDVKALQDKIENKTLTVQDIRDLVKIESGAKFHFLWYLNTEIQNNDTFAQIITDRVNLMLTPKEERSSTKLSNISEENDIVQETIVRNMQTVVDNEVKAMEEIGLFDEETKNDGSKVLIYQAEFGTLLGDPKSPQAREKFESEIRDFIWQDIAANINIIQITGGDLALYGNAVNYQKRIAQIHSPGLHVMSNEEYDDGYLRSVRISDIFIRKEMENNTAATLERYLERNRDKMTAAEAEDFRMMISIIVDGIHRKEVTDGQSFSSPTSIRKKLASQGEWDPAHEEAYNAVVSGNYNINHLAVLMQPTKPFVTSSQAKYSGSPTMDIRKIIIQDKNSEYLIILAEALARSEGKRSKLVAICDFMEQSARENPKKGIDTVHFESVNKVGKSGIIDINAFDEAFNQRVAAGEITEDKYNAALTEYMMRHIRPSNTNVKNGSIESLEMRQGLEEMVKEGTLKEEETMYNTSFVDTIPMEDYIIQQEVPAHLLDHQQLYGSQIRILGISDITPSTPGNPTIFDVRGEKMTGEDLVDEYKSIHARNVRESYDNLLEELGIKELKAKQEGEFSLSNTDNLRTADRNRVFQRLESLLHKELDKDAKYDTDYKRACTLKYDAAGNVIDFATPLSDPMQSNRIQMLLNSIIKKEINKQKIKGGPVVQATAYDRNLHIVFKDREGNILPTYEESGMSEEAFKQFLKDKHASIAYYECYMPVPDATLERMMTKPDGSMMTIEEVKEALGPDVWKSFSEIIGYRIPTEDKYSMVPMKIVGFVPKAAGQVVMLPQEITYLTGSDFDIDKMYTMLRSFDVDVDVEENPWEVWKEYCEATGKAYPQTIESAKSIREGVQTIMNLGKNVATSEGEYWNHEHVIRSEYFRGKDVYDFMDWYAKRMLGRMFKEFTDQNAKNKRNAKEARNNRLIDLQWAVLTNEDTTAKMLNPGNFDEAKKEGRIIRILKGQQGKEKIYTYEELSQMSIDELDVIMENANPHNTTLPSSKIYFQKQNMQGTQMVGLFANHNVSHAFCSFQSIGINLAKSTNDNRSFVLGGHMIGSPNEMVILDRLQGFNGRLISKTIASFLAASVDTAKDPVLNDLNVNTFTGGIAMLMARLGYDTSMIGLFLSQPVIVELSNLYFKKSQERNYDGNMAIQEMASLIGLNEESLKDNRVIREKGEREVLSKKNLIEGLVDDSWDTEGENFQKKVLRAFYTMYNMSKDLSDLTFCTKFNSVSNAVGPTIADTMEDKEKVTSFFSNIDDTCFHSPSDIDGEIETENGEVVTLTDPTQIIHNDPILNAFYTCTVGEGGASEKIFSLFFPHYYEGFKNVLSVFKEKYLKRGRINAKTYNQLLNAYMYYLMTYNAPKEGFRPTMPSDDEHMKRLAKEIVTGLEKVRSIKGRRPNILIDKKAGANCLIVRKADEFLAIDTLVFYGGQLNSESQQDVKDAWSELITMDDPNLSLEENETIRRFGVDLFFYTLMRNGFGFSPKTLMHLASYIVRYNATYWDGYENYIDGLRKLELTDNHLCVKSGFGVEIENNRFLSHVENFLDQFMRNHSNNGTLIPVLDDENELVGDTYVDTVTKERGIPISVPIKDAHKLGKILLEKNKPYQYITIIKKDARGRSKRVLYKLEGNVEKDNGQFVVKYKEVEALGIPNSFIEYSANSHLPHSLYTDMRNDSEDALQDEEDNDAATREEPKDVSSEAKKEVDSLARIMSKLEGPQKGNSSTSLTYRKELKELFKSTEATTPLGMSFRELLNPEMSTDEKQATMDHINKTVKEMNEVKKENNKCPS